MQVKFGDVFPTYKKALQQSKAQLNDLHSSASTSFEHQVVSELATLHNLAAASKGHGDSFAAQAPSIHIF